MIRARLIDIAEFAVTGIALGLVFAFVVAVG